MSAVAGQTPAGFAVRLPETWVEIDIWRATRTGDLARLVDARIADLPALAPHRGALLKALREAAGAAERQGAVFCAAVADAVPAGGVLTATLMVFQTDPAPDPVHDTVEVIAGQVTAVAPAEDSPYWRRVDIVDLPSGRAVRVVGVEAAEARGDAPLLGVVMQTLVPVPGDQGVLNMVLSSPQTELAEPLLDLFDAISTTLTWPASHAHPAPVG